MTEILAPISAGELIDKLTILHLKSERIEDPVKLANVEREQAALQAVADRALPACPDLDALRDELLEINADLWQIEDDLRAHERDRDFGPGFVGLARSVYILNDRRAALKRKINLLLGSAFVEEKSYSNDRTGS